MNDFTVNSFTNIPCIPVNTQYVLMRLEPVGLGIKPPTLQGRGKTCAQDELGFLLHNVGAFQIHPLKGPCHEMIENS